MRQRAERRQRISGDAPEARLQSIGVGETRRDADGAAAIGAQRQRAETRGERGGGTAGRSARRLGLVPRIARDAGERRIRAALPAIFRRGGFADQDRARFFQPRDRRRIFIPRAFGIDAVRTAPRGPPLGQQQILHRHRHAIQRRQRIAFLPALLGGFGLRQRGVRIDQAERIHLAVQRLDAREEPLRDLHRRQIAIVISAGELFGSHLMRFGHVIQPFRAGCRDTSRSWRGRRARP